MDEDYAKERQELVSRFRQAIKGQLPDAWFDEGDLLEIFDFAGDNGDDYVRAEALMWGARYFPDSQRLRERRGVFYADVLTDDAVQNFAADTSNPDSLLTQILGMRSERLSRDDARAKIIDIFKNNPNIDDEETIQLVTLADETSNLDWLVENIDYVQTRVGYKPALLYEVAAFSRDHEDFKTAIDMLKRLVDEMPYNVDYWNLLASAYDHEGQNEAALEAREMILAIDPNNPEAIAAKAAYLTENGLQDELFKLYLNNIDNESVSSALIESLCRTHNSKASEYLDRHIKTFGIKDNIVSLCAMYLPDNVYEVADLYYTENCTDNNINDARIWTQWAENLASAGALEGAVFMMEVLLAHQTDENPMIDGAICVLFELYYETQRWQKIYSLLLTYHGAGVVQSMTIGYIIAVAFMNLLMIDAARDTLSSYLNDLKRFNINDLPAWRPEQRISRRQIEKEAKKLLDLLNKPDLNDEDIRGYKPL